MIEAPVTQIQSAVTAAVSESSIYAAVTTTAPSLSVTVDNGRKGDTGADGLPGADGHSPVLTWSGDQIAVDGVASGPHLTGPQGVQGVQGIQGQPGAQGAPGADGAAGSDAAQLVYIQQARPAEPGPWAWWVADASGNIVNLIINNGV